MFVLRGLRVVVCSVLRWSEIGSSLKTDYVNDDILVELILKFTDET